MKRDRVLTDTVSDEYIIELFWQRDQSAIDKTDRKYGRYLYTVAYNLLHDPLDCEECKNSTYLGAWNAIPPDRPNVFKAYLTKIMRRISINRFKEKTRQKRVPSELTESLSELGLDPIDRSTPEEELEAIELGRVISRYLRGLDDRGRCVFISRYYFADPIKQIAKNFGVTESAIYKELTAIRDGLKGHLEREGFEL
ncbi:MAG: sigma-70 family RNA polymerase sigma factor [Clostridia bacterium]|nr:sigma-70 family RNA polymerase sigma factor [Clostridia bacterium]MBQ3549870.1 sigma-70 family RNA polymerase sigma factor [Clostridia bacterium]